MTLQGWSLPLSPGGAAALVPPPPWHFSGDAIGIDFKGDPAAMAAVLPAGLEPVGDGSASFVFCDWSSSADVDPRIIADPARGQYKEAYVAVHALVLGFALIRPGREAGTETPGPASMLLARLVDRVLDGFADS